MIQDKLFPVSWRDSKIKGALSGEVSKVMAFYLQYPKFQIIGYNFWTSRPTAYRFRDVFTPLSDVCERHAISSLGVQ